MASHEEIAAIEAELQRQRPRRWRRLTTEELHQELLTLFQSGWRVEIAEGEIRPAGVDHFILVIDAAFPNSQPRILAPGMGSDFRWPHVEPKGLLCLRPTSLAAPAADRVRLHLGDALELLNYPEEKCTAEFEREFGAYWSHQAIRPQESLRVVSLVKPGGRSRQVFFHLDRRLSRLVVADAKAEAKAWLNSAGSPIGDHDVLPGLLVRLKKPWAPAEFPKTVGDTVVGLPEEAVRATLLPNRKSLFLFEATTATGPVFAAVLASGAKSDKIKNGFRSWNQVPIEHIKRAMAQQRVERVVVSRADAPWIHGRGHSADQAALQARKVAVIGCGSVGSEVAELLAKAGVGELSFVDSDDLMSANVGRHLLGISYLGWNKAKGVATELRRRLPHLKVGSTCMSKFERLKPAELAWLAGMDMIVTAGLDIEGEVAVNAWRQTLERPPAYLSTWVEAYALVGHAVLLFGKEDLMTRFEGERPEFRLTDWPAGTGGLIVEAGCGNVFQPHGAVDLQTSTAMAARLALDAILGRVPASCRRVWFGDREAVAAHGGLVREGFTEVNAMRQFSW
ncbi:ThiF family adenylyltransferase [Paucibacter sp. O1-1]|nr:ThiF family adenylyltransferase [Paucibacter sp. O1-1]MDA3829855.1 ThiF family adenylyltransferase [Paucibacter sp. O1-1]